MKAGVIQSCPLRRGHLSLKHGVVNRHDCRILGSEKPMPQWSMLPAAPRPTWGNVIISDRIVGPCFYNGSTTTCAVCLDMSRVLCVPTDSWRWRPHFPAGWCTSPFSCLCTNDFLISGSTGECSLICSQGVLALFWGWDKNIAHCERVDSLPDLRRKITVAIAAVPVDVLSRMWGEVEFLFEACRAVSDAHIEWH
jgi:hypothetical protein